MVIKRFEQYSMKGEEGHHLRHRCLTFTRKANNAIDRNQKKRRQSSSCDPYGKFFVRIKMRITFICPTPVIEAEEWIFAANVVSILHEYSLNGISVKAWRNEEKDIIKWIIVEDIYRLLSSVLIINKCISPWPSFLCQLNTLIIFDHSSVFNCK
jgi:hypothetical protein